MWLVYILYLIYYLCPLTKFTSFIIKSWKITRLHNLIKCTLSVVTPPLQESCHSIHSLLYGICGVILSEMFLHEAISMYCLLFIFDNITWPRQTIKMWLSYCPIALPLVCPGLFHSALFTVIFDIYIIHCMYHMHGCHVKK